MKYVKKDNFTMLDVDTKNDVINFRILVLLVNIVIYLLFK
jgi:hypothetical protein